MANSKKLSLQEEVERDVQQIEKEIAEHKDLEQITVTEEMDAALFNKIKAYEAAKIVSHKKRKMRWYLVLAAVLVLALGIGSTSMGSKSYWKKLYNILMGEESIRVIDVEEMDKQDTKDIEAISIYKEIEDKFGITVVRMRYKPKKMRLIECEIDEELQLARLTYDYEGSHIRYTIYASNEDSSWTEKEEDPKISESIMEVGTVEIKVEEIEKPNQTVNTSVAGFEYQGVHYELKGEIKSDEFNKILNDLYFF